MLRCAKSSPCPSSASSSSSVCVWSVEGDKEQRAVIQITAVRTGRTGALDEHAGDDDGVEEEEVGPVGELLVLQQAEEEVEAAVVEPPGGLEEPRVPLVDERVVVVEEERVAGHLSVCLPCCV